VTREKLASILSADEFNFAYEIQEKFKYLPDENRLRYQIGAAWKEYLVETNS